MTLVVPKSIFNHKSPKIQNNLYPSLNVQHKYNIGQNPYDTIYVDLTYKCNMSCNFCYNPVRALPDMDIKYFEEVCKSLPKTVLFRLLGGEPTLHKDFFEFIKVAHKHRHLVSIVSNGIKFNDKSFTQELKNMKIPLIIGLSLDGGRNNNEWYEKIVNMPCADIKMGALQNLAEAGFKRVSISAIIVKGLNEGVIPDLLDIQEEYVKTVRYIHYRTSSNIGRYDDEYIDTYTAPELNAVVDGYIKEKYNLKEPRRIIRNGKTPTDGQGNEMPVKEKGIPNRICRNCCNQYWLHSRLQISIIEFGTDNSSLCWHRGKLMNDYTIQPFFENMLAFSDKLEMDKQ